MKGVLIVFVALGMLFTCINCLNWQGTGEMTQENMTIINNHINGHFPYGNPIGTAIGSGDNSLSNYAESLSTYLNGLWDIAWNVVISYAFNADNYSLTPNSDTIVYGYAFRKHWLWMNGLKMNDGHYIGIIIWKDYNCKTWHTLNINDPNFISYSFAPVDVDRIVTLVNKYSLKASPDDIWLAAKGSIDYVTSDINYQGNSKAFTIIANQYNSYFYSRVCVKDFLIGVDPMGYKSKLPWGSYMILQMR